MNNVKSSSEDIAKAVSETTKHVEFWRLLIPKSVQTCKLLQKFCK